MPPIMPLFSQWTQHPLPSQVPFSDAEICYRVHALALQESAGMEFVSRKTKPMSAAW